MFGFGLTNQVLVLFLESVEISQSNIGLFMTLTLLGDVLISWLLSWNADYIGRRRVLILSTLMMVVAGGMFTWRSEYLVLLISAIIGVISPSGDETGPFKTIEEACLAHLTPDHSRPQVFAFHGLFATTGNALGSLLCGFVVDYLNLTLQWDLLSCYRVIFGFYTFIGVIKFFIMISLSHECEIDNKPVHVTNTSSTDNGEYDVNDDEIIGQLAESTPLLEEDSNDNDSIVMASTWNVASRLLVVFFLDSLGYGFMPASWVVYYFKIIFKTSASVLGTLFFITSLFNTFTAIPSALLSMVLGPVKAILAVQAPSAIFFIAIVFTHNFMVASVLLVLYYATMSMDVVPRQVLLTSVVKKEDLTKVMGTVNTVKTFARCVGPIFTGKLAESGVLSWGFIINGSLTLLADIVLGLNFINLDSKILKKQQR